MRAPGAVLLACSLASLGACAGPEGPLGDARHGVEVVSAEGIVAFHEHASAFYARLTGRRFNTYGTFQDARLRDHFRTDRQFYDYYADLAQALADAHFEKNRPLEAVVEEFLFDAPGRARVRFLLRGENDLPLRWQEVAIVREDVWERSGGRWWIVPGKL